MSVGGDEVRVTRWVWEVPRSMLPDGCGMWLCGPAVQSLAKNFICLHCTHFCNFFTLFKPSVGLNTLLCMLINIFTPCSDHFRLLINTLLHYITLHLSALHTSVHAHKCFHSLFKLSQTHYKHSFFPLHVSTLHVLLCLLIY